MSKLLEGAADGVMKMVVDRAREIQQEHYRATTPMDSYFTGIYNGMEVLIASFEGKEGNFKAVEQLSFAEIKPQDAVGVDHG